MKDGGSACLQVETVVTAGNGFLLDRGSRSRRQNPSGETTERRTKTRKKWHRWIFGTDVIRIAVGITRITRAGLSARHTAPERQYWNMNGLSARSSGSRHPGAARLVRSLAALTAPEGCRVYFDPFEVVEIARPAIGRSHPCPHRKCCLPAFCQTDRGRGQPSVQGRWCVSRSVSRTPM